MDSSVQWGERGRNPVPEGKGVGQNVSSQAIQNGAVATKLEWHYNEEGEMTCNACGSRVWSFKEGPICDGCKASDDWPEAKKQAKLMRLKDILSWVLNDQDKYWCVLQEANDLVDELIEDSGIVS